MLSSYDLVRILSKITLTNRIGTYGNRIIAQMFRFLFNGDRNIGQMFGTFIIVDRIKVGLKLHKYARYVNPLQRLYCILYLQTDDI